MTEIQLLIGTGNRGKVREIRRALSGLHIILRTLEEFPEIMAPEEVGDSFEANARIKACYYSNQTGIATLADDSGLEVNALNGKPGLHSARYGGPDRTDEERVELLLAELTNQNDRRARFVCAMVLEGEMRTFVEETVEGKISLEPQGANGFGYDPVFIPNGYDQSFGLLSADLKQQISHRGKALAKIREFIELYIAEKYTTAV